jgi:hypothetical protein
MQNNGPADDKEGISPHTELQNETELDVWRTARNRYCRAQFSTDFGVHRDPATSHPL